MERLRKDFGTKYMSMLETEKREEPNMPFIEKVCVNTDLQLP